jgi:hypothetical protein
VKRKKKRKRSEESRPVALSAVAFGIYLPKLDGGEFEFQMSWPRRDYIGLVDSHIHNSHRKHTHKNKHAFLNAVL